MVTINLSKSIRGFMELYLVNTGIRFGIFPILCSSSGLTTGELAAKIRIPEKYVRVWCNTAFAFEVLGKKKAISFS